MGKLVTLVAGAAGLAVACTLPPAHATATQTVVLGADGAVQTLDLDAGTYRLTARGTYIYDREFGLLADAECSADRPASRQVVDVIAHDDQHVGYHSLYPTPLSGWQRYRYTVSLDAEDHSPLWTDKATDDTLDVYLDGGPVEWLPLTPTPVDDGPGVDAGCDTAGHEYTAVLMTFGGEHTLRIFDTNYFDNADDGGVTVTVTPIG